MADSVPATATACRYVYSHDELVEAMRKYKVAMVGSGSYACAIMPIISNNVVRVAGGYPIMQWGFPCCISTVTILQ